MAVTPGFVMQIGSYPPAVAVPPVVQPVQSSHPLIEAEKIAEPGSSARSGVSRNDFMQQPNHYGPSRSQPLAYTNRGERVYTTEREAGALLDMFA